MEFEELNAGLLKTAASIQEESERPVTGAMLRRMERLAESLRGEVRALRLAQERDRR